MRIFSFLLSLIFPGWGHIIMGFCQKGVVLFGLFAFCMNGAFLSLVAWLDDSTRDHLFWSSLLLALVFWVYSIRDIYYIALFRPSIRVRTYVEERLRRAILAYLQSDFPRALRHLKKVLKRDKYNPDAYFYLGLIHKRQSQERQALFCFKKCILLDYREKWCKPISNLYTEWREETP